MQSEKKLIQLFKAFIEKALVPQIKKMEGSLFEWNKFNQLISQQTVNFAEVQQFVDSLGPTPTVTMMSSPSFQRKDNLARFSKKRQDDEFSPSVQSFNPSKTFGGDRARMMFPLKNEFDDSSDRRQFNYPTKDFGSNKNLSGQQPWQGMNPQTYLPGLDRLSKIFSQNHAKIENFLMGSNNNLPVVSEFAPNGQNRPMY